jgi:hypothetical protein
MTERMAKFLERNKESVDKLNKYINEHHDDIRMMIVSPELFYTFKEYYESDCTDYQEKSEYMEEHMKYKGLRMVRDNYSPAKRLYFVKKSESIDFDLPCIGGYYHDEHDFLK